MVKSNFRQDVTDKIIDLMEKGAAPWQKPWDEKLSSRILKRPLNAITNRPYHGGNAMHLMLSGLRKDQGQDPRWCTFKQASEKGWKIKKSEKSTVVEYWKFFDKEINEKGEEVLLDHKKAQVFYAHVFHASQIEGISPYQPEVQRQWEPNIYAERILKSSGAMIQHDQTDRAFYSPGRDEIHLPPKAAFKKDGAYYSTSLHELGHWTGHESRLNRDIKNQFGTEGYAREELRAEMASVYLSMETGVSFDPSQHAAYNQSWITVLKNDKNEFFRSTADAEKIADFVITLAKEKVVDKTVVEDPERLEAIQNETKHRTLPERYRSEFKGLFGQGMSYAEIDLKVAEKLLLGGEYSSSRIKEVVQKHSPIAAQTKGYANKIVKGLLTPEFKAEMRNKSFAMSR
jgi:antirestriction protein ArdC